MKDTPYVKVLDTHMKLEEAMIIMLEAPPSDLSFTDDGALIILMPAPIFMKVVDISEFRPGATVEEYGDHDEEVLTNTFRLYCRQKGNVNFTQYVGNIEEGGGLKKQTLDKRFLSEKILARKGVARRSKSRGGKRCRKHLEGEQKETKQQGEGDSCDSYYNRE